MPRIWTVGMYLPTASQSEASLTQSPLQSPVYSITTLYKIGVTFRVSIGGREEKNYGTHSRHKPCYLNSSSQTFA